MSPNNLLLRRLCARLGCTSPELAIRRAIEATFPDLGKLTPPIDPYRLALTRGIRVQSDEMKPDGLVSRTGAGNYVIHINVNQSEMRRRFTLAHEIAHTVLFNLDEELLRERTRARIKLAQCDLQEYVVDSEEENVCNAMAAEILMPGVQFSAKLGAASPTAKNVLRLGREFQTSIQATALRTVELSLYKLMICMWAYSTANAAYEAIWTAKPGRQGGRRAERLLVRPEQPIFRALDGEEQFCGRRWVSLGGPPEEYFVDGVALQGRQGRTVLTVFILEPFAEELVSQGLQEPECGQLELFAWI